MDEEEDKPVTNLHPLVEAAANTGGSDPAVQAWQAQAASMVQDHLQQRAMIDQADAQRQQLVQGTATTRDNLTSMVRNDPTATPLAFKLADHFTEALGASHGGDEGAAAGADMAGHFRGEIAKAAVQGWAAKDEGVARAALDRYGEHLSDDEKAGLDQYISNVATFRAADAQAAQINQHHFALQTSNTGTASYMSQLTHPENGSIQFPPGWGQQVMTDPRLAPDAKAALFNGYTNLQRNGEPLASDPNLVTDLLARSALAYNHPDHPLTPEIAGHLGTGLTMADAQFLAAKTGPQSSAARLGTQQLVQTMDDAREEIGNPRAYARFVDWLLPAVRNGAILDPNHKDYLLTPERMAQFQPTGDDVIAPVLARNPFRDGPRASLSDIFGGNAGRVPTDDDIEHEQNVERLQGAIRSQAENDPVLDHQPPPMGPIHRTTPGYPADKMPHKPGRNQQDEGDPVIGRAPFDPGIRMPTIDGPAVEFNGNHLPGYDNSPKDM